jgi:BirA family biotin operon repressor/biotin-[acetyl-CoA-carboxylase] ligase
MKTLFIGQNSIHLNAVDSTNSYASELLRQIKPAEGTIFYSFEQQKGRGQRGNSWESEPNKNLALSLVLYPTFLNADMQFLLTKITSLAVADLMAEVLETSDKTEQVSIKWPNDIYVNDKKIAGILIENVLRENSIQSSIIGIGININQTIFSSIVNATSLILHTGKIVDLIQLIERLCEFTEARYLQLKANKLKNIDSTYLERLYKINEWTSFISNSQIFEGKITGVSAIGRLQVELRTNELKEFDLKEINSYNSLS